MPSSKSPVVRVKPAHRQQRQRLLPPRQPRNRSRSGLVRRPGRHVSHPARSVTAWSSPRRRRAQADPCGQHCRRRPGKHGVCTDGRHLEPARTNQPSEKRSCAPIIGVKPDFTVDAASVHRHRRHEPLSPAQERSRPTTSPSPPAGRAATRSRHRADPSNAHGTFYEVPRADVGGFQRMRPITTHNKRISDFCRWRGLLVLAGASPTPRPASTATNPTDGKAGLWFGDVDDLWRMGAPAARAGRGRIRRGGKRAQRTVSDDGLRPKNHGAVPRRARSGCRYSGSGLPGERDLAQYARFTVPPGQKFLHAFPKGYSAHWIRLRIQPRRRKRQPCSPTEIDPPESSDDAALN